ncbi:MAG TPA: MBL fold metallo-hydrolase [Roseiflexaceae bacterium]|jgi:glyoxylase-like metal-dependent hydrolase (beta-lactamase superfamily II)|nr:MBL fold metallo-hydrolase [Roseiflexaceae bacterium]
MMKTQQISANLAQLTRLKMVNCYLVREADGFTLIDTGMSGSADAILKAAQQLGAPIVRIALTHPHSDHVGSLDALHAALPNAEVSISARDARFLAGDMRLDADEPQDKLRGGFPQVTTRPDRLLAAGDRVGSLEVVAAPGHTPGHVAFFDTRDGTLIAGDAFYTIGGVTVTSVMRWRFPLPYMATWSKPRALQSARVLRALNPTRLAIGHGKVIDQPAGAIDAAIREAAGKLGEVGDGARQRA